MFKSILKRNDIKQIKSSINLFLNNKNCFSSQVLPKKDYYGILEIPKDATLYDIKKSYRNLAKKFHPDVNTNTKLTSENILNLEKFRDIAEAYAVLSNIVSKQRYDISLKPDPSQIYNKYKDKLDKDNTNRDNTGNLVKEKYLKGSYEDFKKEAMKNWRKENNVDALGNFKGGVPRKMKGAIRNGASGLPGAPYSAYDHNDEWADNPLAKNIVNEDVVNHQHFNNLKKVQNLRFKPYFNIEKREMDDQYEQTNENRNTFRYPLLFYIFVAGYFIYHRLYHNYLFRINSNTNLNIKDFKVHQYDQLGPLIIEANEFKFKGKKFLDKAEYHKWLANDLRSFKV